MITAGCDIGSLTAKAVILKDSEIMAKEIIRATARPEESALAVMKLICAAAGINMENIDRLVGTGYGRKHIPFVNSVESEIACHARGAFHQAPGTRTVIDIGGQDAKAIRIDDRGEVIRYAYNDKCASGTGRFLEIIADSLDLSLEELGALSQKATEILTISNQCVVFAETEIISLVNEGREIPDIISALHRAVANRVASLARGIGVEEEVLMTGGVAKNPGMFSALAGALGVELRAVSDPQMNGALGAALIAEDDLTGKSKR
jgi:(R)-2-hydroxyacyl-CoA dehydratese activating ATPase